MMFPHEDYWGWISALISCVCFGSFGVPIKSDAAKRVDIDPLVFQTYKTVICFLTSWFVLCFGQEFTFSPWGIVSGLFWVPSGIAAIYAVKNAGLAVSQGTWSSLIVLVSFFWGIFIFHECVHSKQMSSVAIFFMISGLWGMSYYSSNTHLDNNHNYDRHPDDFCLDSIMKDIRKDPHATTLNKRRSTTTTATKNEKDFHYIKVYNQNTVNNNISHTYDVNDENDKTCLDLNPMKCDDIEKESLYPISKRRYVLGLLSAIFNGLWGGSIMVPMHFSG